MIEAGGVQWMTAGSGLIHAEVSPPSFKRDGGALEILQLWINLPARLKMTEPRYSGVQREQIPGVPLGEHARLDLIAGTLEGMEGPIHSLTGVFMSTLRLTAGARVELPAPQARSVFLYLARGSATIAGTVVDRWHLVEMNDDGDSILIEANEHALIAFGHADPIGEPVVARGPFVMNSEAEIRQAIADYQAGRFNAAGKLLEVGE